MTAEQTRLSPYDERTPTLLVAVGGTGKHAALEVAKALKAAGMHCDEKSDHTDSIVSVLFVDGNRHELGVEDVEDPQAFLLKEAGVRTVHLHTPNRTELLRRTRMQPVLTPDFPSADDAEGCQGDRRVGTVQYTLVRHMSPPNPAVNPRDAILDIIGQWKDVQKGIFMGPSVRVIVVGGMHGGTGPAALAIAADAVAVVRALLPDKQVISELHMMTGESAILDETMRDGNQDKRMFNGLVQMMYANAATHHGGVALPNGDFIDALPAQVMMFLGGESPYVTVARHGGHYQPAEANAKTIAARVLSAHTGGQRSNIIPGLNIPHPDLDATNTPLRRFSVEGVSELLPEIPREVLEAQKRRAVFKKTVGLNVKNEGAISEERPRVNTPITVDTILAGVVLPAIAVGRLDPVHAAANIDSVLREFTGRSLSGLETSVRDGVMAAVSTYLANLTAALERTRKTHGVTTAAALADFLKKDLIAFRVSFARQSRHATEELARLTPLLLQKAEAIRTLDTPATTPVTPLNELTAENVPAVQWGRLNEGAVAEAVRSIESTLDVSHVVDSLDLPEISRGNLQVVNAYTNAATVANTFLTTDVQGIRADVMPLVAGRRSAFIVSLRDTVATIVRTHGVVNGAEVLKRLHQMLTGMKARLTRDARSAQTVVTEKSQALRIKADSIVRMGAQPTFFGREKYVTNVTTAVTEMITIGEEIAQAQARHEFLDGMVFEVDSANGLLDGLKTVSVDASTPFVQSAQTEKIREAVQSFVADADRIASLTAQQHANQSMLVAIDANQGLMHHVSDSFVAVEKTEQAAQRVLADIQPEGLTVTTPFDVKVPVELSYTVDADALRGGLTDWSEADMMRVARSVHLEEGDINLLARLSEGSDGAAVLSAMTKLSTPLMQVAQPGLKTPGMKEVKQVTVPTAQQLELGVDGEIKNPGGLPIPRGFTAFPVAADGRYLLTQERHAIDPLAIRYFFTALQKFLHLPQAEREKFFTVRGDMERMLPPFATHLAQMEFEAAGRRGNIVKSEEDGLDRYVSPEQARLELARIAEATGTAVDKVTR